MNTAKPTTLQLKHAESKVYVFPTVVEVDGGAVVGSGTPVAVTLKELAEMIAEHLPESGTPGTGD